MAHTSGSDQCVRRTVEDGGPETGYRPLSSHKGVEKCSEEGSTADTTSLSERGSWTSHAEFVLSCLGFAVGLGNVWRFPYLCYKNGGGAFLIPYTCMLMIVGVPLFYMELALGQFAARGPVKIFANMAPLFSGLGVAMIVINWIFSIFYIVIISWSFFYLFASMQHTLPWADCNNYWNTNDCVPLVEKNQCTKSGGVFFNRTCFNETQVAGLPPQLTVHTAENISTPSQEYFK